MPNYKISFERRVVEIETYEVIVDAPSREAAEDCAQWLAGTFDSSCPDGLGSNGVECQSWSGDVDGETDEPAEERAVPINDGDPAPLYMCEPIDTPHEAPVVLIKPEAIGSYEPPHAG